MLLAISVLLLLIVLNGIFSMSEIAMVSARRPRLEAAAEAHRSGAAAALALRRDPNRFLSTVQIGITLIGILAGAFGEAAIAGDITTALQARGMSPLHANIVGTVIVVALITYLSLVVGELVPKRIGLARPERIAMAVAPPMRVLSRIASPVVWFLSASTNLLLRPFGKRLSEEHAVTEDDIRGMIEQATESGAVHEQEQEIVERVFEAGDLHVRAIMVPRPEIEYLEVDTAPDRIRVAVATAVHSHFPVCRDGLDHIVGTVHVKDVLRTAMLGEEIDLRTIAAPPLFIPETMPVLKLLEQFRIEQRRIALVVNEYGGLEGLVTVKDIVEALLGRLAPAEAGDPEVVRRDDGSWLIDAALPVNQLRELLSIERLDPAGDYQTVGGYVLARLGHMPRTGERFQASGHTFEIVDMDGRRIDRLLITPDPQPAPGAEPHSPD